MLNTARTLFNNPQFQGVAYMQICNTFSSNLVAPVLPLYLAMQGLPAASIGMVMGVAAVGAMIVRPWAGRGVDTKGSRPIIFGGQFLMAVCFSAYLLFTDFLPMLIIRFLHGAAMAFYGTATVTFVSNVETSQNTAAAISLYTVFTMVGMGSATSLAPFVFHEAGFLPLVGLSLAALSLAVFFSLRRLKPIAPVRGAGTMPFTAVLRNKAVWAPTVGLFASNFAFSTLFTFVPLFALAEGASGYSAFYVSFAIAVVATRLGVQTLTQAFRPERVATAANLMNLSSALILALYPSALTFALSGVLVGLGFGILFPTLTVYVVQRIPPAVKGTALSILTAAGDVGNALGASLLGIVAELLGFRWVFILCALVVLGCTRYFYAALTNSPAATNHNA